MSKMYGFKTGDKVVLTKSIFPKFVGCIGEVYGPSPKTGRIVVEYKGCFGFEGKELWNSKAKDLIKIREYENKTFLPNTSQDV